MNSRRMFTGALLASALAACMPWAAFSQEQVRTVGFDDCLGIIRKMAQDFRVTPENIAETADVRVVRFNTVDGGVIVACSRADRKMVIKKSP